MRKKDTIRQLFTRMKQEGVHTPSDSFRKNARIRIMNTLSQPSVSNAVSNLRRIWFIPIFRMTVICLVIAVNILYAAQYSNPSDPLFPVKVLSERIALSLSPDEQTKTKVANTIINRRAKEAEDAKLSGDREEINSTLRTFQSTVTELHTSTTLPTEEIEKKLLDSTEDKSDDSEDVKGESTIQSHIEPVAPTPTAIHNDKEDIEKTDTGLSEPPEIRITETEDPEPSHD